MGWVGEHPVASIALFIGGTLFSYYPLSLGTGEVADNLYGSGAARNYVRSQGYADAHLKQVDHVLVGFKDCHGPGIESKAVEYEFSATSPNGNPVEVDVCEGIFTGPELVVER